MLRQGMPRIFTLNRNTIAEDRGKLRQNGLVETVAHYQTLAQVKKCLLQGNTIELRKHVLMDGHEAQVSWSQHLKAWVIATKNVSLVARALTDVTLLYPEQSRFKVTRQIALCWFKKLESFSSAQLNALKAEMQDKTFIGVYVGSASELVKHDRETIVFHGIVSNKRVASLAAQHAYCLPNSTQILVAHGLETVVMQSFGTFDTYDSVCDALVQIYDNVAGSELASTEQGALIYFVKKSN